MLQLRFLNETELNTGLEYLIKHGAINIGDDTLTATVTADEIIIQAKSGKHTGLRIALSNSAANRDKESTDSIEDS